MTTEPFDFARFAQLEARIPKNYNMADTMCERIEHAIARFQAGLAEDEEVGACLAQFGQAITIRVSDIGYHNPHLIKFYGETPQGDRCELVQHMSQVNFLLVALKATAQPARRIGFGNDSDEEAPKQE